MTTNAAAKTLISFIIISGLQPHHYAGGSEFSSAFVFLDFAAAQQTRPAPTAKAPPAANATVNAAIDIINFIITSGLLLRQHQRDAEFYTGYRTDRKSASRGS